MATTALIAVQDGIRENGQADAGGLIMIEEGRRIRSEKPVVTVHFLRLGRQRTGVKGNRKEKPSLLSAKRTGFFWKEETCHRAGCIHLILA